MQISAIRGVQKNNYSSSFKGVNLVLNKDTLLMKDCIGGLVKRNEANGVQSSIKNFEASLQSLSNKFNKYIETIAASKNMTMEQLWPETTNIKISPDYNFDWSQLPYKISAQNISSKNADNVIINTFNISHEDSAEGMLEGFVKFLNSDSSNLKSYIKNLLRERPAIVQENAQRIKNLNK